MSDSFDPYRVWLGIPPESRPPTHYELLGISPSEQERAVIEAAVLRQSGYVRNFQLGKYAKEAAKILNEIAAAKACLLNAEKRAKYDAELKARQPAVVSSSPQTVPAAPLPLVDLNQLAASTKSPHSSVPGITRSVGVPSGNRNRSSFPWQIPIAVAATLAMVVVASIMLRPRGREEPINEITIDSGRTTDAIELDAGSGPLAAAESSEPVMLQGSVVTADRPEPSAPVVEAKAADEAALATHSPTTVDLLKLIDLDRDGISGDWRLENGKLRIIDGDGAVLKIPYRPAGDYVLRVTARRAAFGARGDYGGIVLPVIHANGLVSAYIAGGWRGSTIIGIEPLAEAPDFFPSADPSKITCEVRSDGFVIRNESGAKIERNDVYERVTGGWHDVPEGWLRFAAYGNYEISELTVSPAALVADSDSVSQNSADSAVSRDAQELLTHAVAWYRAEGSADDSTGKHHGRLSGGAAITPTKIGYAFDFDGKDGSVVVPDAPELNPSKQFTVMAWICPRSTSGCAELISKNGNAGGSAGYAFGLGPDESSLFIQSSAPGESWPGNRFEAKSAMPIAVGDWAHVVSAYDGDRLNLYVNGALIGSKHIGSKSVAPSIVNLRISSDENGNCPFNGLLDDAALLDRALSEAEIKTIYLGTREHRSGSLSKEQQSLLGRYENAGTVDVLPLIDPARDAVSGHWTKDAAGLHSPADSYLAALRLPVAAPHEYCLTIVAERPIGWKGKLPLLNVGLVGDRAQWNATIDWNEAAGLELIDGKSAVENQSTVRRGNLFRDGQASVVTYIVRRSGVEVQFDGHPLLDWHGDYARLGLHPDYQQRLNSPLRLFLGTHCNWHFKSIRLTPLADPASVPDTDSQPAVNLLTTIDLKRHIVRGPWAFDGPVLVAPPNVGHAIVRIPGAVPDEYHLRMVVELPRDHQGFHEFAFGLVTPPTQVHVVLDSGKVSGFATLDGKPHDANETTFNGQLFIPGVESTIDCFVRKEVIRVDFDGRTIINWRGDRHRLASDWLKVGAPKRNLYLGTHHKFFIRKMELVPLK